jgi:hypothetical protein
MKYLTKTIITLLLFTQSLTAKAELKKTTLQLSWFNQFQFGIDIPKEVSDNKIDFAIGKQTLLLERSKNKNIVALYALFKLAHLFF